MATILIVVLLLASIGVGYGLRAKKHSETLAQARKAAEKIIEHERQKTKAEVAEYEKIVFKKPNNIKRPLTKNSQMIYMIINVKRRGLNKE